MERKILPLGYQHFRDLREDNCIYVDKTQHIYRLCTLGKQYFLSRPRRFGKSLLLSTLEELFKGEKDLFDGLWIADKWDWTKKNPIIHISFNVIEYEIVGLEEGITLMLLDFYKKNALIAPKSADIKTLFFNLIEELHEKHGKVVVLIDDYDKPIMDCLEHNDIEKAKANQKILLRFYSILKDAGTYTRLLFITGISKFILTPLNLLDLTIHPFYSTILGYTQEELEENFPDYIEDALKAFPHYNQQELLAKIRLWYNGYSWDAKTKLYNPFDILLFLDTLDFQAFWVKSGKPILFAPKMLEKAFFDDDNIEIHTVFSNKYNLDNIELTSLLFQTGYLTIKEKLEDGELILSYPNQEIHRAMHSFLIGGI
jgi:hypothetical protein